MYVDLYNAHHELTNSEQFFASKMVRSERLAIRDLIAAGYHCILSHNLRSILVARGKSSIAVCKANSDFTFSAIIINTFNRDNCLISSN